MAHGLGVPLFEIVSSCGRPFRQLICAFKTIKLLFSCLPRVVVCQNPSIVLSVLILALRPLLRARVAVDAHFGGIDSGNGSAAPQRLLDWCNRAADLVIVTNPQHASHVDELGGKSFICPDPLPDLCRFSNLSPVCPKKVFLICSFDPDEPFREVFAAAEDLLVDGFRLFCSGNYRKAGISPDDYSHVVMLGFVPESEFYSSLFDSEIVIDLTDNDDCLVCGAYEAMEAEKPLVLSDKPALRSYFTSGVVFTENRAPQIAAAIRRAHDFRTELASDAARWARQAKQESSTRLSALRAALDAL